ncbi:MAG: hypothetical protein IH795_04165 [Bacteroidetes bacterium]|nr:hypothetical protein [Bacteroidota bacterium]
MQKIPVKIIEFADGDNMIQEVMIDLVDSMQLEGDPGKKIDKFRDKYFKLVKKAEKLFFGKDVKKTKKRRSFPSSVYWKLGNMFGKFNDETKNKFDLKKRTAYLSKILDWYSSDFGNDDKSILLYISQFLDSEIADDIRRNSSQWEIDHLSYNWDLNELN